MFRHVPRSGAAKTANDAFNVSYSTLLLDLHKTFEGTPAKPDDAIGDMDTVKQDAATVMGTPLGDGTNAGPSFEYVPSG